MIEVLDLGIGEVPLEPKQTDRFPAGFAEGRRELLLGDLQPLDPGRFLPAFEVRVVTVDEHAIHVEDHGSWLVGH